MTNRLKRSFSLLVLLYVISMCFACGRKLTWPSPGVPQPAPTATPAPSPTPVPTPVPPAFGYFFNDGRYGDLYSETSCYTNLYVAWAERGYALSTEEPIESWLPRMVDLVGRAHRDGKRIVLDLNMQAGTPIGPVLAAMLPFASSIEWIELADEPSWDKPLLESKLWHVREELVRLGWGRNVPLGIIVTESQALYENLGEAEGLDFIVFEAYLDPPGGSAEENAADLRRKLALFTARLRPGMEFAIVVQGYSRNYGWANIDTLAALQRPPFDQFRNDPRLLYWSIFSWGRPSGSREYPPLSEAQRAIARELGIFSCEP